MARLLEAPEPERPGFYSQPSLRPKELPWEYINLRFLAAAQGGQIQYTERVNLGLANGEMKFLNVKTWGTSSATHGAGRGGKWVNYRRWGVTLILELGESFSGLGLQWDSTREPGQRISPRPRRTLRSPGQTDSKSHSDQRDWVLGAMTIEDTVKEEPGTLDISCLGAKTHSREIFPHPST